MQTSYEIHFDRPRQVRFTLRGFQLFYDRTHIDPFEWLASGELTEHFVLFWWCMAVIDHPALTLETARQTFTPDKWVTLGLRMIGDAAPKPKFTGN